MRTAGRIQHVLIGDPTVLEFLIAVWGSRAPSAKLMNLQLRDLEAWFRAACTWFGLRVGAFQPSGLRAGGATYEYMMGTSVERLMWRGRWDSLATLKHYIQEATAVSATARLPPEALRRIAEMAERCIAVLATLVRG